MVGKTLGIVRKHLSERQKTHHHLGRVSRPRPKGRDPGRAPELRGSRAPGETKVARVHRTKDSRGDSSTEKNARDLDRVPLKGSGTCV